MKVRKWISLLLTVAFIIAIFRYISYQNYSSRNPNQAIPLPKLRIQETLREVKNHGDLFEFNDFFTDIKILKYSFESLTNGLSAEPGEEWTAYTWHEFEPGHGYTTGIKIYDSYGEWIGWIVPSTETKPASNEGVIEWIKFIGLFLQYIGKMFVSLGRVLINVLKSIINATYKIAMLIYYICFHYEAPQPL